MEERGGRLLDPLGTVEGILGENGSDAQGTDACRLSPGCRLACSSIVWTREATLRRCSSAGR